MRRAADEKSRRLPGIQEKAYLIFLSEIS